MADESGRFGSPIDLAREADLVLGTLRISPSTREVARGQLREMLEPRVMQVLVTLFQAHGRVVSRDELIARCWEGRIVGEDAINRAVGRLRRLSEVDAQASFRLDTIPRVGYRLIPGDVKSQEGKAGSPAVISPPTGVLGPDEPTPSYASVQRSQALDWLIAAGGFLVAVLAGLLVWHLWPSTLPEQWFVRSSRPLIDSLALEDYPAFSPNGDFLAYASGSVGVPRKIYLHSLAGGDSVRLTNDSYDDISPSWSSDGARIVYIGHQDGSPCHIMMATVPAGQSREVGRCRGLADTIVTWQPGTNFVYFVERRGLTGDAIYRLDIDSGSETPIAQNKQVNQMIYTLSCSPDGKFLAYIEHGRGIVMHDLTTGSERVLNPGKYLDNNGWLAWPSDSQSIFATISGGAGSEIVVYPLPQDRHRYSIYSTASRVGRLAINGQHLALETDISRINLARVTQTPEAQADMVEAANGYSWSPTFAPDGTLAFLSNRSGSNAVWLLKPGASIATELYGGGFAHLYKVSYSPDGSQLALVTLTSKDVNIRVLSPAGASIQSFDMPSLGLGLPTWTSDGKGLLVFDSRDKRTWSIDVSNPSHRKPVAPPHWVGVTMRPQGTIATRADKPGIWRIDEGIHQIDETYPAFADSTLAFRGIDVLVPQYVTNGTPRVVAKPLEGGPPTFVGYSPGAINRADFQSSFAVDPRSGQVIYSAMVVQDTNVDLLTLAKHQQ